MPIAVAIVLLAMDASAQDVARMAQVVQTYVDSSTAADLARTDSSPSARQSLDQKEKARWKQRAFFRSQRAA